MNVFKCIKQAYYRVFDIYTYQSVGFTELDELVEDFRYYLTSAVRGIVIAVIPWFFIVQFNQFIRSLVDTHENGFGFIIALTDFIIKTLPLLVIPIVLFYTFYLFLAWRIEKLIPFDLNKSNRIEGENNHVSDEF